jgi:hypothetical protein
MRATASLGACLDAYLNPKARRTAAGAALQVSEKILKELNLEVPHLAHVS